MSPLSRKQLTRIRRSEAVRVLRIVCSVLGVFALALALMAVRNTVGNPETWPSAFNALAAAGAFSQYAGWLVAVGALLLLIALLLNFYPESGNESGK